VQVESRELDAPQHANGLIIAAYDPTPGLVAPPSRLGRCDRAGRFTPQPVVLNPGSTLLRARRLLTPIHYSLRDSATPLDSEQIEK